MDDRRAECDERRERFDIRAARDRAPGEALGDARATTTTNVSNARPGPSGTRGVRRAPATASSRSRCARRNTPWVPRGGTRGARGNSGGSARPRRTRPRRGSGGSSTRRRRRTSREAAGGAARAPSSGDPRPSRSAPLVLFVVVCQQRHEEKISKTGRRFENRARATASDWVRRAATIR